MPQPRRRSVRPRGAGLPSAGLGLVLAWAGLDGLPTPALAQVPGPEIFARAPTTPMELWDAIDYLVRTDQADKALPYLRTFLKNNPDDAALLRVRDRYGYASVLRLQDHPATRTLAEPLVFRFNEAVRRVTTDPRRIAAAIGLLTKSPEEQALGVERLREAGASAVPPLFRALKDAPSAEDRALIVAGIGRLDRSALPPLLAGLDANDPALGAAAADALGRIGSPRATVWLTAAAVRPDTPPAVRQAARKAYERINGRPFFARPADALPLLLGEVRRYQTHALGFPGGLVQVWAWDASAQVPAPRTVSRAEAEGILGGKLADAAVAADPASLDARAARVALSLGTAIERVGYSNFPANDPGGAYPKALDAGPNVLARVLTTALADGNGDLAAVAATAYGTRAQADRSVPLPPLVKALGSPSRRARFAAVRAIVTVNPAGPFPGSSRVVPTLAQFAASGPLPKAVIIDGNLPRGSQLSGFVKALGYEPVLEPTGADGFRAASESADVDVVFVDIHLISGDWRLHDTIANLRSDARTAGLPIYLVGPLSKQVDLASLVERFPGLRMIVNPLSAASLSEQLDRVGRPEPQPAAERQNLTAQAAGLLAGIAVSPASPFRADLLRVEPELLYALNEPGTATVAAVALGPLPDANAQRSLAEVAVDAGRSVALRRAAAAQLVQSVRKFGPLIAADQETQLLAASRSEADPGLRDILTAAVAALRPEPPRNTPRPRAAAPAPTPAPAQPPPRT